MASLDDLQRAANLFEARVMEHMDLIGNHQGEIDRRVRDIHHWVSEQRNNAATEENTEKLQKVMRILVTTSQVLDQLSSEDAVSIMQGCIEIAGCATALVGGPAGVICSAMCTIVNTVITSQRGSKPSLAIQLADTVHSELAKFHNRLLNDRFNGLKLGAANLMRNLDHLRAADQLQDAEKLPDDFLRFIGEVSTGFTDKTLSKSSKKADVDEVVASMLIYCQAQTCLRVLLTAIINRYQILGKETRFMQNMLQTLNDDARDKLGSLSGENGAQMDEEDRLCRIYALFTNAKAYPYVETFRQSLDMDSIAEKPTLDMFLATDPDALFEAKAYPNEKDFYDRQTWAEKLTQLKVRGYFQLVNETNFPIKVISGTAGETAQGLNFIQNVQPRSAYDHMFEPGAFTMRFRKLVFPYFFVGIYGDVVAYLDGEVQPDDEPYEGNIKRFEFHIWVEEAVESLYRFSIEDKTGNDRAEVETRHPGIITLRERILWQHKMAFFATHTDIDHHANTLAFRLAIQEFVPQMPKENACVIS